MPNFPPLLNLGPLPELRVPSATDWPVRRADIQKLVENHLFGPLPPTPAATRAELLCSIRHAKIPDLLVETHRIITRAPDYAFELTLFRPASDAPLPLIIDGDACWSRVDTELLALLARRGFALAYFNRCAIAPDTADCRAQGLFAQFPNAPFGAISAWAWACHRVIDALLPHPAIAPKRIIVTGHSRGGKAALYAGATDTRVALTNPNCSGCMGAGSLRQLHPDAELLHHITRNFPHWFPPTLTPQTSPLDLPLDLHFLKALVAPRALLCTESRDDLWANPPGTALTHDAIRSLWQLLNVPARLALHFRNGPHAHTLDDWQTLLAFTESLPSS